MFLFFCKQKTAYEMRISDWSSDVCSSDLPEIMVIGCVDSRVSPEVIFDAAPGELLVVRNVANLVPRYEPDRDSQHGTSAALEFGVRSEERRVGKECVSTCRSRRSPYP